MKKLIVFSIVAVLTCMAAVAQESAICGDWVGVYKGVDVVGSDDDRHMIDVDRKRYIRIKSIGGSYTVRMKTRLADGSEPFNYSPECHIIEATDYKIKWKMNLGPEYDWSPTDKHNGVQIGHADYYEYCTVTLSNGVLKYSEYLHIIYYDRQGRVIDSEDCLEKSGQTLYKEDSDW